MDGQRQDEFIHCTSPGLEKERFCILSIADRNSVLFTNVCAGFICRCYGEGRRREGVGDGAFWAFWVLLGVLCIWRVLALLYFPSCRQDSAYGGVPIAGYALWAEVGGGIICVTLGEFTGLHKKVPQNDRGGGSNSIFQSCTWLASAGLPSLHDY